jgi:hypothetical protein
MEGAESFKFPWAIRKMAGDEVTNLDESRHGAWSHPTLAYDRPTF